MKFSKPEPITKTGWTDWITPDNPENYKIACCDCGLVHVFELRSVVVTQKGSSFTMRDAVMDKRKNQRLTVALRAKRDNRATAQVRNRKRRHGERLDYTKK